MIPNVQDLLAESLLNYFKSVCFVCGETFWPWQKHNCKASPQERAAFEYVTKRQSEMQEAQKRGRHTSSHVGLTTKPCPRCDGRRGNVRCPLCDGDGFVPSNML